MCSEHGELQGNTLIKLKSLPLVKKVVNKCPDPYDLSLKNKNSNISPEIPSFIIYNTKEVGYRNRTLFVLNDERYEKADWETLDNIFDIMNGNDVEIEIEINKDQENVKDQTSTEQKSSHCPFGNNCSQIHNSFQTYSIKEIKPKNGEIQHLFL